MTELLEGVILAVVLLAVGFFAGRRTTSPVEGKEVELVGGEFLGLLVEMELEGLEFGRWDDGRFILQR